MDSVSQFVLGAAIGEATLGSRMGRKAMLVGGLLGTLPDLDVIVHYSDAIAAFTYHRSWSHSIFVLSLASLPIAWLLARYFPDRWLLGEKGRLPKTSRRSFNRWLLCVWLILITHAILDGFTIYGTQLFWPLPVEPIAWGSVFIIDPLYTVPIIIGLIVAIRNRRIARRAALVSLLISSCYLGVTLLVQHSIRLKSVRALALQNLGTENVLVAPTPLSLLWRVVSMDGEQYHEGFTSILDHSDVIRFTSYDSQRGLIDEHLAHWPIARMDWFTGQMISASRVDDKLIINDLRMGIESSYIFRFSVGQWNQNEFEPLKSVQMPLKIDTERMRALLRRTWDESLVVD